MKKSSRVAAVSCILLASILAGCTDEVAVSPGQVPIGTARQSYVDEVRLNWDETGPRPLTTTIWYPAADDVEMTEILIPGVRPVFSGGWASRTRQSRIH